MATTTTIQQIVYWLEDQNKPGYYLTTSASYGADETIVGYGDIVSHNSDGANNLIDISKNMEFRDIIKLGIQAPPGTKFSLVGKSIMMGTSGLYELDEESLPDNVVLYFEPQTIYELDEEASADLLESAKKKMNEAEAKRIAQLANLNPDDYLSYIDVNDEFYNEYNTAVMEYYYGTQGVYTSETTTEKLKNIIIDVIYKGADNQ